MSLTPPTERADRKPLEERILELEEIEEELEVVAMSDLPYAKWCRRWLTLLREVRVG